MRNRAWYKSYSRNQQQSSNPPPGPLGVKYNGNLADLSKQIFNRD